MAGEEVIKSFLVGLGFGVDKASLDAFNKALSSATLKVTALLGSTVATASGVALGITKISESFEEIGYQYRIITPAINKAIVLRREMLKAYSAAGINLQQTAVAAVKLNMSIAKTKFALDAIYKSVGAKFFSLLTKQSDLFRKQIYANMPKIQAALEKMVAFIFKALDAVTSLGLRLWSILQRVWDFFVKLDEVTGGWSTKIIAAIAIWKALNLAFLATPLGMLFTLATTLLALYDDFKTFKEGGKSLIDWGSDTVKTITGLIGTIGSLVAILYVGKQAVSAFKTALEAWKAIQQIIGIIKGLNTVLGITDILTIALEAPLWAIGAAVAALVVGLTWLDAKFSIFGGHLSGFFSGIGGKILDWIGGAGAKLAPNIAANAQNAPAGVPPIAPPGVNTSNNTSNKNLSYILQQQTSIYTQPGADANTLGQTSSKDTKINFDRVRNMQGAVTQ